MPDLTEHEIEAVQATSEIAGAYIEKLGETDMAKWSSDQWLGFLETVSVGFTTALRDLTSSDEIPF